MISGLVVTLCCIASSPGEPQRPAAAANTATAAARPQTPVELFRERVGVLTSETMEGRAAGTAGGESAIRYLVDCFDQAGLAAIAGGGLRQDFAAPPPPSAIASGAAFTVLVTGRDARTLVAGSQWAPMGFSPDGEFAGDIVFVGHGLQIPELAIDDYARVDVAGRVVAMLRGGPRWRAQGAPVKEFMPRLSFREKAALAQRRGAKGIVLIERAGEVPALTLDAAVVAHAVGDSALPFVLVERAEAAAWFGGEDGLREAQDQLDVGGRPVSLVAGSAVRMRVELVRQPPRATANVVGVVPGTDSAVVRQYVVVGAHHDHLGRGQFGSLAQGSDLGRIHPGADDNASGTAAMLDLAQRFRRRGTRRSIVFVAFGAEELGQCGSRWFLDHLPVKGDVVAMVDLNMIGRAKSSGLTVFGLGTGSTFAEVFASARTGLGLEIDLRDRSSYRSDQSVFLERRIPSLLVTTGLHAQYHTPGDVAALIEVDAAVEVVDLVERFVRGVADGAGCSFVAPKGK